MRAWSLVSGPAGNCHKAAKQALSCRLDFASMDFNTVFDRSGSIGRLCFVPRDARPSEPDSQLSSHFTVTSFPISRTAQIWTSIE